ncbi:cytochrome P450 83B1 [Citrus sinensis]|uniref:Cytochrome P450 83B1 n=1 Tax=Citrus sinensis TaxID=2711 RepID=A0ACB8KTI7_CITSI|nr:cytochrome P450 83B1 [Citrus sinensis]
MALLIIFLVSLPVIIYFLHLQRKRINKAKTTSGLLPPGPRGLLLIGNLHQLESTNLHYQLWNLSKKYGPLMSLRLGLVQTVVVSSVKMAKEALKTHDVEFSGRPALVGQQKLTYNGLDVAFAPYNDYWKEMRKICVTHLFNASRVHHFRAVREDEVARMIEKISSLSSSPATAVINISECLMSLTNSVICMVAFGKKFENKAGERSKFHSLLDETRVVLGAFYFKDFFPFLGGFFDKLSGITRRLENNFKEFDAFYQQLIEEHADPNRPKDQIRGDIIDVLLQVQKDRAEDEVHGFSRDNIKAVLMNVFVGATDTSAATMTWAMTNVMKNPRVMEKAQKEVRDLIGNKGFVDEDDLQKLPYIKAILKETFRLNPPGPIIPRETTKSCMIDGYEIPAKTLVYLNGWAISRDPEVWERPDEFDPDRFIIGDKSYIELTGQNNYELIPFGGGRRFCPGTHMGIATLELAIANLLYKFDWEMPAGMKIQDLDFDIAPGIVMHKKNPLCLVATKYM